MFNGKTILITGGTGSFGRRFTRYIFDNYMVKKLIIFSRDEYKQYRMSTVFKRDKYPIRFFLGDVRDRERLYRAFDGVDYVIHTAALKHVPAAEYNPFEVVKTNIIGAQNIVEAAIDKGVRKVVALSTDKAVSPINLYGATKLAMEKIFVAASSYVGWKNTSFCVVRYGNVLGSRGSVVPYFLDLAQRGETEFPVTDPRMTRFWITIDEAAQFVHMALSHSSGGEVFVPKIPSMRVTDLAEAVCPGARTKVVGIRPGEKLHESLITSDEAGTALECSHEGKSLFVILPDYHMESPGDMKYNNCKQVPQGYNYRSDTNDTWLTIDQMRHHIEVYKKNREQADNLWKTEY